MIHFKPRLVSRYIVGAPQTTAAPSEGNLKGRTDLIPMKISSSGRLACTVRFCLEGGKVHRWGLSGRPGWRRTHRRFDE